MKAFAPLLLVVVALAACTGGKTERAPLPGLQGDPARGEAVVRSVGCGACHVIDEIRTARGVVGPPLSSLSQRTMIAGRIPNTPENLVQWLMDPHAVDPKTAMPDLGLDLQQARDVAAFLYSMD